MIFGTSLRRPSIGCFFVTKTITSWSLTMTIINGHLVNNYVLEWPKFNNYLSKWKKFGQFSFSSSFVFSSFFPCQKLTQCNGWVRSQSHNLMEIPIFSFSHVLQHKFLNGDDDGVVANVWGLGWRVSGKEVWGFLNHGIQHIICESCKMCNMVLGWKIGESFASGYHNDM
jgi:hypothetical protein